jgi:hypothetical protein
MAEVGVVNASPLIFFCRGGHLPLLRIVAAQALAVIHQELLRARHAARHAWQDSLASAVRG